MSITNVGVAVPWLRTEQMVEVDRAMIEDLGIELIQMMENAGRGLAHLARERFLDHDPTDTRVAVLAGPGGNGGGALVCARRLVGWGANVEVVLSRPDEAFDPVPGYQLTILRKMGVPCGAAGDSITPRSTDLVIDGLIGYNLRGAPRGASADLIRWANVQGSPVLSLDVPSGVDAGSGEVYDPAVRAAATLTLALPKTGLRSPDAGGCVGELYLADIGVPSSLYASPSLGLEVPDRLFATGDIVRL
jgi:NAD(P)H-hydrate epimerase